MQFCFYFIGENQRKRQLNLLSYFSSSQRRNRLFSQTKHPVTCKIKSKHVVFVNPIAFKTNLVTDTFHQLP